MRLASARLSPCGLDRSRHGQAPVGRVAAARRGCLHGESYNLVGFQTNLTFPEQKRVFRMIPGLEQAEFARYGVMHRNTFIDAPKLLTPELTPRSTAGVDVPVFVAGQIGRYRGLLRGHPLGAACGVGMSQRCSAA